MIVDELIAVLGYDLKGEADRRRFEAGLDRLRARMQGFAVAATRFGVIAAGAAATGFGVLGRAVVRTSAEFESYQATLETIEGSAEKARQSLDWIAEFAKTTPYDVAQVTQAFIKLKAYGIDPVADDALRTLGDTASAMGKPIMQAVEALADAQTGEFERLKEFGIRASQEGDSVTFRWTKNGEELTETVKKSATEIRQFLLETMGDRFTGAMDRQSRTWNGMMSNLGDTWTDFQRRIGEAGFFEVVSDQLRGLLNWLQRMDAEGSLQRWAERFSNALSAAAGFAGDMVQHIGQQLSTLRELFANERFREVAVGFGIAMAIAFAWARPAATALAALALAADDLISYLGGGESVIGDAIEWFERWAGTVEDNAPGASTKLNILGVTVDFLAGTFRNLVAALTEMKEFFNADLGWAERMDQLFGGISSMGRSFLPEGGWLGESGDAAKEWGDRLRRRLLGVDEGSLAPAPAPSGPAPDPSAYMQRLSDLSQLGGAGGIVTDQSNRSVNVESNITVNQTVTQPTAAPGAAAQATGNAVGQAVGSAARVQAEGAR